VIPSPSPDSPRPSLWSRWYVFPFTGKFEIPCRRCGHDSCFHTIEGKGGHNLSFLGVIFGACEAEGIMTHYGPPCECPAFLPPPKPKEEC
jgi:hypothetical protein